MELRHWLKRFLNRFGLVSAEFSPSALRSLSLDEELARFLVDQGHFVASNNRVKRKAFEPAKDGTTSVFRVYELTESAIWDIGDRQVAPGRGKPVLARADITVAAVRAQGLHVEPDDHPPRHAAFTNWPADKAERMSICQRLAAEATLYIKGTPAA